MNKRILAAIISCTAVVIFMRCNKKYEIMQSEKNKLFVIELMKTKRALKDFPENVSKELVIYEPAMLPFGGIYKGVDAQEKLLMKLGAFYDFSRLKIHGVFADGNVVFAILQIGILGLEKDILICEKFVFVDGKVAEVRVFVYDDPAVSSL